MRCGGRTINGKRCGANALSGGTCCYFHSEPGRAQAAGSKGGRRRAIYRFEDLKHFEPARSAADLVIIVGQTLADVRNGMMDARSGNAISGLASTLMRLIETSSLEQRLCVLEKKAEEAKHGRPN